MRTRIGLIGLMVLAGLITWWWSARPDSPVDPGAAAVGPLGTIPAAAGGPYRVLEVIDGDTIRVRTDAGTTTVRLIGIDTPEKAGPYTKEECFGREATSRTRALLEGRRVALEADPTQDAQDRYGRLLAYVWREDGLLVNEALIAEGYAFEYTYDVPYHYLDQFEAAERAARGSARGLWAPSTCAGRVKR